MINRRLIVWLAIGWTLGIGLASQPIVIIGLFGIGVVLLLAAAVMLKEATRRNALLCIAVYCAGVIWASWSDHRAATGLSDLLEAAERDYPPATFEVEVDGTIVSAILVDGDSVRFQLQGSVVKVNAELTTRALHETLQVQLKLLTEEEQRQVYTWQRGERVHAVGELERPAGPSNEGGFDYRSYLKSTSHIHWLLKVKGTEATTVTPGSPYSISTLLGRVDAVRDWLGAQMDELYPEEQAGYMKGLVLGSSDDIDPDVFGQFSALGLTHILAISGLHVAVFLYAVHAILRMVRLSRERSLLVMAALTPLYVLLSGASPSVVRAGLMAVIGLIAAYSNRLKDGLHLLSASAILMLLWNPSYIHNVGFQLSYLVTAGLIVGVSPMRALLPQWRRGKAMLDLVVVTLVAQLVSFPVSIYYFNQWNPLSIPANFVFVPFISFVVMPLGAASLALGPVWPLVGQWLAVAGQTMNGLTFMLVQYTAELQGWQTVWAKTPIWWIAAWYIALGIGFRMAGQWSLHRKASREEHATAGDGITLPLSSNSQSHAVTSKRKQLAGMAAAIVMLAALLTYAWLPDTTDRTARFSALDIGQGDSLLIRTGSGMHVLVDGRGTVSFGKKKEEWQERRDPYEVGRKVLVPLLKQRGVHAIDLLVISHLDADHIGGLQAVMESIPVRRIWWNGTVKHSEDAVKLMETAIKLNVPMYEATAGMNWQLDTSVSLDVLWPEKSATADSLREVEDQNESSVAMMLTMYGRTFLLTGDIGNESELALLNHFANQSACESIGSSDSPSGAGGGHCLDVLKVGHHGSKGSTSASWISYWRPAYAVISVGKDNVYRHPNKETLERLEQAGVRLWRTDRDGETTFAVQPNGELLVRWVRHKWVDRM
ncbi:competence protein ComEC [Paenibacillus cellulosilyticus]|uniref:Competence protein ComEC n=1 Tax=Paenibacillus cellulosilyticus TaxID=375489 RepID=A0A2V2YS53_9BACL|nr:DNA internalization-related competence protein ComEC/Rec2 [Paenibacillus cellulosilyticus]PWV98407.1 competence protein ComEC [Paenibacillus cellulosilyticus]QKS43255.1 DNA internalization-related competence protein ComEC/Rec2 [Paenibacillus cellulosilyticus]